MDQESGFNFSWVHYTITQRTSFLNIFFHFWRFSSFFSYAQEGQVIYGCERALKETFSVWSNKNLCINKWKIEIIVQRMTAKITKDVAENKNQSGTFH